MTVPAAPGVAPPRLTVSRTVVPIATCAPLPRLELAWPLMTWAWVVVAVLFGATTTTSEPQAEVAGWLLASPLYCAMN